jgi:hypothetical protein
MRKRTSSLLTATLVFASMGALSSSARAQAWHYPTYQPPVIATREFNFGVSGSDAYGTTGIFQWREGIGPDTHLNLDVGFASPSGSTGFLIGGGIGQRILRATPDTPIDMVLTGGIYGEFGVKPNYVRIPLGVSVGHRFPIQGTRTALTPYVHPRLSLDACVSDCHGIGTDVNVNFDIGADFEATRVLSLRGALTVGGVGAGSSKVGFGFGLVFRPATLGRR